jgi:hypothetical protein
MFKCELLATTAIVVVGSLSSFAAQSGAVARAVSAGPGRDRNSDFLCSYGQLSVYAFETGGSSGSSSYVGWQHVAVPIVGHGRTVSRITVREQNVGDGGGHFSIGIYSDTPSGLPGNLISGGKAKASTNCGPVRVRIAPTTLARNKPYWVEETVSWPHIWGNERAVGWASEHVSKRKAYEQYYMRSCCSSSSSYTSPWTEQSAGPWFILR